MIPEQFPGRGKVAALKTRPETVLTDVGEVMRLAGYQDALPRDHDTILKINISWQTWYPACSTTPWQLEGVIRTLQDDGYRNLIGAHNGTVVVDARVGERNNKQLPTVKTHVFTTITGAMKNAFGGLLNNRRHHTHAVIDETLVDLLQIQQDIHSGLFAVMDGTFAGDGAGPRAMRAHEKDILLASADQVAIDAISAKMQGFNPMDLSFIRIAHEKGLGVGEPKDIEIVGYDVSLEDWKFVKEDTFASKGQHLIYHGPLKRFEKQLLQSPLAGWSYFASNLYHNVYWYPVVGRKRVKDALETKWGRLFESYGDGRVVLPGPEPKPTAIAAGGAAGLLAAMILAARVARRA